MTYALEAAVHGYVGATGEEGALTVQGHLHGAPRREMGSAFNFTSACPICRPKIPVQSAPVSGTIRDGVRKKGEPSGQKGPRGAVISG